MYYVSKIIHCKILHLVSYNKWMKYGQYTTVVLKMVSRDPQRLKKIYIFTVAEISGEN